MTINQMKGMVNMYRIGVISDTHGLLREEVKEELRGCAAILHGGDIHKQVILEELQSIGTSYVVRGNADKEWAEFLPKILDIELFGIRIKMIHNKKDLPKNLSDTDLVIFGHSHKYADYVEEGIRWLNPGSCGPRRFHQPVTMAVIEVTENKTFEVKKIDIAQVLPIEVLKLPEKEQDRQKLVQTVMKEVDKGKSVKKIAESLNISAELAEQICRMYLTHPGVDVDGILNRIS